MPQTIWPSVYTPKYPSENWPKLFNLINLILSLRREDNNYIYKFVFFQLSWAGGWTLCAPPGDSGTFLEAPLRGSWLGWAGSTLTGGNILFCSSKKIQNTSNNWVSFDWANQVLLCSSVLLLLRSKEAWSGSTFFLFNVKLPYLKLIDKFWLNQSILRHT